MSKRWILLLGLLAVCGLVACKATEAPTLEPEATVAQPTATRIEVAATATQAQKNVPTATSATASKPKAVATPPWQIPTLQESDWTKGAEDAGLVLVEYSDFQ
jgi:hypothetical protein